KVSNNSQLQNNGYLFIFVIMNEETLSIKNMVCQRCISAVETILAEQNIKAEKVSLGEVILSQPLSSMGKQQLSEKLEKTGFEILDNKEQALVSSIKNLLIDLIHRQDLSDFQQNSSDYLSQKLHKDYNYLSKLFSEMETITIEKYIIQLKIEKVKELLVYNEL